MRNINKIIVHCSDSDLPAHDNIEIIRKWHVEERGWQDVGYHYVITKDGRISMGRWLRDVGAHAQGHNAKSIGICLTGKIKFSEAQMTTLIGLCWNLIDVFTLTIHDVIGHYEVTRGKTCPNINMEQFRSALWTNNRLV